MSLKSFFKNIKILKSDHFISSQSMDNENYSENIEINELSHDKLITEETIENNNENNTENNTQNSIANSEYSEDDLEYINIRKPSLYRMKNVESLNFSNSFYNNFEIKIHKSLYNSKNDLNNNGKQEEYYNRKNDDYISDSEDDETNDSTTKFHEKYTIDNFNRFILINDDDDINMNLLSNNIESINNQSINQNEINTILDHYVNLIQKLFNERRLQSLYSIKEAFNNCKIESIKEKIQNQINYVVHIVGKELIQGNKLTSLEIIQFFTNDIKNYCTDYQTDTEYASLLSNLSMEDITDEFCEIFNFSNANYENLLHSNYKLFIQSIVKSASKLKHLNSLYKIFEMKSKHSKPNHEIVSLLIDTLNHIEIERGSLSMEQLGQIVGLLFSMASECENDVQDNLFHNVINNFTKKESIGIFILTLYNYSDKLNKNLEKQLSEYIEKVTSEDILTYLNYYDHSLIKYFFLNKLNEKIASKIGVLDKGLSEHLKSIKKDYFDKINNKENTVDDNLEESGKNNSSLSDIINVEEIMKISYDSIMIIFKAIYQYVSGITERYMDNESKIRISSTYKVEDYLEMKTLLEDNVKSEFDKYYLYQIFKNIYPKDSSKYIGIIYKDYISYYLLRNNVAYSNESLRFFNSLKKLIVSNNNKNERMNEEEEEEKEEEEGEGETDLSIDNFYKFILYLESYSEYIIFAYKFVIFMMSHIDDFMDSFILTFHSKKFQYEDIIHNNKNIVSRNSAYANDIPYNLFESILYCILTLQISFNDMKYKKLREIMAEIKTFSEGTMKIDYDLNLHLRQTVYLNHLLLIFDSFSRNRIKWKNSFQDYYDILGNENKALTLGEKADYGIFELDITNEIIEDEYNFLRDNFSKEANYSDLVIKLLSEKMTKAKGDRCMKVAALDILCSDNSLLSKSKQLFENYFTRFHLCPQILQERDELSRRYDYRWNDYYSEIEDEENDMDRTTGISFLSEMEREKFNSVIRKLNSIRNTNLDEILLFVFDKNFVNYFEAIKSAIRDHSNKKFISNSNQVILEKMLSGQSLKIFQKCVEFIQREGCTITKNNKLSILYCLSFIKYYCFYLSDYLYHQEEEEESELLINEIFRIQNLSNEFKNVIKLYILKVLNQLFIGNYSMFLDFIKRKQLFINDFSFNDTTESSLSYFFLQNNSINDYRRLKEMYVHVKNNNFASVDEIIALINEDRPDEDSVKKFLIFYDVIINEEISQVRNHFNPLHFQKLSHFLVKIENQLHLSNLSKRILNIYFNNTSLQNQLNSLKLLSPLTNEMLLYAHKFSLICSFSRPDSVFSSFLSPNTKEHLKNTYIPGEGSNNSLLIKSGYEIYEYLQNGGRDAVYMCSCNNWYTISKCGFPTVILTCSVCGLPIGGTGHKLIERPNHYRIYLSESFKKNDRYSGMFSVPHIFLNNLMEKVENEKKKQYSGFKRVQRTFFLNEKRTVRNMSHVTYRILNFIFFSCIYTDEKLGYLSFLDLNDFYYLDADDHNQYKSILSVLTDLWDVMNHELNKRGVTNIQCFLNSIIPELAQLIIENDKNCHDPIERENFESLCDRIIETSISNYESNFKTYVEYNTMMLQNKENTMKSILEETCSLRELPQKFYPLISYFMVVDYPTNENFDEFFKSVPGRKEKYPMITNYLSAFNSTEGNPLEFNETFEKINPLITYAVTKYKNKISRKEAKAILIEDELVKDYQMKILFKDFKKGWAKVYKQLSNYDCHGQLPPKNITEKDSLAYLLNDDVEDDYGKYIASYYNNILIYQNEFLQSLHHVPHHPSNQRFSSPPPEEIKIQNADQHEIVSQKIKSPLFNSFRDIIYTFSVRNSHIEKEELDGLNRKRILFDVDAIENELQKLLLSNKKKLSLDEKEFMYYSSEGFTKHGSLLSNYQETNTNDAALSNKEKFTISYVCDTIDYKVVLSNLQLLILYFTRDRNITGEETLLSEILKMPKGIITLDTPFIRKIHNSPLKRIKMKKLIGLYEYIEEIHSEKIIKEVPRNTTLDQKELKEIDQHINVYAELESDQLNEIHEHFRRESLLITRDDFKQGLRKFISRFLISEQFKRFEWNLIDILRYQDDLWSYEPENESRFDDEMDELHNINITVEQTLDLYKKI
ncbi:hypothetical protein H8356DRAFT_1656684 [Neocallimastix lanati (nom. inval.)]|nr:hypothetical protein H8356DRAFT_1656684 [Neocallimastix sp. JGI-2020a]